MVGNRVRRRLRATGIGSFADYYTFLTSPAGNGEMPLFLDAITTNETYFFRDPQHYDWLGDTLPPRDRRAGGAAETAQKPADLVGGVQHRRRALLDRAQAPEQEAAVRRLADHDPRHRPERRGAGRRPRRPLRRPGRPLDRAGPAAGVFRRGPGQAERWTVKPEVKALVTWKQHNLLVSARSKSRSIAFSSKMC